MGIYYCFGKGGESKKLWETGQETRPSVTKIPTKAGRWVPQVYPVVCLLFRFLWGGLASHIIWGGSGMCSFRGLNAIQTPVLGSYCSTPTTTRTKSCPR